MMTGAPKFVTMRLGKDSVADIKRIDACEGGIQDPPIFLSVTCKQVPRELKTGTFVLLWLGSDNSKGIKTAWKQGVRAVARIEEVKLGEKHNDDSVTIVSIGYAFPMSMDKIDLLEANPEAYVHFSDLPLVGLSEYANQTIRKVEYGKRSDMGALLVACGAAINSSLKDLFVVYPDLRKLVEDSVFPQARRLSISASIGEPHNLIYFGAPGTGKSHSLNVLAGKYFDKAHTRRVTFHPDYSYASFVGCYKPAMRWPKQKDDESLSENMGRPYVSYEFVPGPLVKSYVEAMTHPAENFLLIVEEINRANPAAAFGDVFQLLDRDGDGESEYDVDVPVDLGEHLWKEFCHTSGRADEVPGLYSREENAACRVNTMRLPSNLYIWATMNSADQGVFPMDTAFKRRWEFRYMGIDEGEGKYAGKVVRIGSRREPVEWNALRHAINGLLKGKARVNEDKLLGPFFLKESTLDDDEGFDEAFKSKVLLYLYEDAAKMKRPKVFRHPDFTYSEICAEYDSSADGVFALDTPVERAAEGEDADGDAETGAEA